MFIKKVYEKIIDCFFRLIEILFTSPFYFLGFHSRVGILSLLIIIFLPALIPVLTYGILFKYLGLYWLTIGLFSMFYAIYSYVTDDIWSGLVLKVKGILKTLLKLVLSPLSWLGFITLIIIGAISLKMFMLMVLYLIALVIYNIYDNRFTIKNTKERAKYLFHATHCDICDEAINKTDYYERPFTYEKRIDKDSSQKGIVCKSCQNKHSRFLQYSLDTIKDIEEHLAYMRDNLNQSFKTEERIFTPTWEGEYLLEDYGRGGYDPEILIDTKQHTFKIHPASDILNLKDVSDCRFIVKPFVQKNVTYITVADLQNARTSDSDVVNAITRANKITHYKDGSKVENEKYGKIPRYLGFNKQYHNFYIDIKINHPYFSTINIKLNSNPVYTNDPKHIYDAYIEQGKEICEKLS